MKKIAVFTGSRAEYGLLYWVMKAINDDANLELQVIVSGAHLSPAFGDTWKEIVADGFTIDAKVDMLLSADTPVGVIKSMGLAAIGLADALSRLQPDALFILGDRYESLVAAQAALVLNIPVLHAHGGELTFGAYDDAMRHAITKIAALHFVANDTYRQRVIQMGESPATVFDVGAFGLEHVVKTPRLTFDQLATELAIPLQQPYFMVTYHPVTQGDESPEAGFSALLKALDDVPDEHVLFTYPNADNGGYIISQMIEAYCQANPHRAFAVRSLGSRRYMSALAQSVGVLGNSSSGIIEVPSFGIPTVNIGCRQQGRVAARSVLHADSDYKAISAAIQTIKDPDFKAMCSTVHNPYGTGDVSSQVLAILKQQPTLSCAKHFHDWTIHHAS